MNLIAVKNAVKKYGNGENSSYVLNGLNMKVESGSIYAIIGASGCGKTTLISAILGIISLDKGQIEVVGEKVSHKKTNHFLKLIGYMPQTVDLVPELTIKETLKYFGKIYEIKSEEFSQRYETLKNLFELNFDYKKISQISGGEQRRVSFAIALINNPKILILDEPTVGVDVILRNKIWNFMLDAVKSNNQSILISTHYIAEAKCATKCGFMRKGILIAEDTPSNIMTKLGSADLDESFLQLCVSKEEKFSSLKPVYCFAEESLEVSSMNANEKKKISQKIFSRSTMEALFIKELLRLKRSNEIFFLVLLPFILVLLATFCMGGVPTDLKLGVVNKEISQMNQGNYSEFFDRLSIKFLDEITEDKAIKVFYNSFDDAFRDVKNGKLIGFIYIARNFTETFLDYENEIEERNIYTTSAIDVHLDKSNYHLSWFMTEALYVSYYQFDKKYNNKTVEDYPVRVENWSHDVFYDLKSSMISTLLSAGVFFTAIITTSNFLTAARKEIWNRTLIAGSKTSEILLSYLAFATCLNFFQVLEYILLAGFITELMIFDHFLILFVIFMFVATVGSSIAMLTSVIFKEFNELTQTNMFVILISLLLQGSLWPIEGQQPLLQYFTKSLPLSLPSIGVRDIILQNFGLSNWSVQRGFIVLGVWLIPLNLMTLMLLKKNKFV